MEKKSLPRTPVTGDRYALYPDGKRSPLYDERIARATALMREKGIDALLLTKPANMAYLTGDGRLCAYAIITAGQNVALGVPLTDTEDVSTAAYFDIMAGFEDEIGMLHSIHHFFEEFGLEKANVGLEHTFITVAMKGMLTHPHAIPITATTVDCTNIISRLRLVKDGQEIERLRQSARVADAAMEAALKAVCPGITEIEVAGAAEAAMRKAGAEAFYKTYVASGPRTNLAHGLPSHRVIKENDLVIIDIHPTYHGYTSDICRTTCAGKPGEREKEAFGVYLGALEETIAAVKAGVTMDQLEEVSRAIIQQAGYEGHLFGPPIHGVGIEFEEPPLPTGHAFFHGEKAAPPLEEGVVIAVGNCGLYMGDFGIRVEDTVLVTKDGPDVLTEHERRLL